MLPLTETRPKPLLKIANKTILEYNLDALSNIVSEVFLVVGCKKEMIMDYFGLKYKNLKITYVIQKDPLGTGNAVLQAENFVKGNFIVMNGDDIYSREDIKKCVKQYSVLGQKVQTPERFGVLVSKKPFGILDKIVEKPQSFVSDIANTALYFVNDSIFDLLKKTKKSARNEYEFVDAVTEFSKTNKLKIVLTDKWLSIGYPWHLLDINEQLLENIKTSIKGKLEKNANYKGNVIIGKNTLVKHGVYIEGPVIIGDNCSIGPNCYIRPSTTIGNNCHIGNGVEIKNSIVFDNSKIPHLSYVGDSIIGENVNFGAGTKVANLRHDHGNIKSMANGQLVDTGRRKFGTVVGDNVHLGINTCIYPGRKISANKTTLPGEIVTKDI